jgi:hypothetical protein
MSGRSRLLSICALSIVVAFVAGCGEEPASAPSSAETPPPTGLAAVPKLIVPGTQEGFVDLYSKTGVTWAHRGLKGEIENRFNLYDHGSGVAVSDFDGDGKDDIYFTSQVSGNALLKNLGGNRFEDVAEKAGVAMKGRVCIASGFGDYDNDGFPDLFVATTRGGNKLFHNEKNGTFKDVTKQAGMEYTGHSAAVAWFDFDGDGGLDLFVGNTGKYTTEKIDASTGHFEGTALDIPGWTAAPRELALLYRNKRDGTFEEVAKKAGVQGKGWVSDAAVCDYDGDGDADLYVARMFGDNFLYRNKGDGTFEDVTAQSLVRTSTGAMGAKWADVDNDGLFDLYVVDMHSDMWTPVNVPLPMVRDLVRYDSVYGPLKKPKDVLTKTLESLDNPVGVFGNTFFRNRGNGTFEEMSHRAYLENFWPWSIAAGDFDGDTFVDYFVAAGMGYPWDYWSNYLLMNTGNLAFGNRAREHGVEPRPGGDVYAPQTGPRPYTKSSRSAASADFDGDGRLDLIVNNFNHEPSYLHNEFKPKHWLAVKLVGKTVNRDAVGAVVVLKSGETKQVRTVDAGGYLAQSSRVLHFGLGQLTKVDELEVRWPGKKVQKVANPKIDALLTIEEQ